MPLSVEVLTEDEKAALIQNPYCGTLFRYSFVL